MKGINYTLFIVLILLNQPILTDLNSQIFEENNSFLYTVTKGNYYIEIGDNVASSNGYLFNGLELKPPVLVNVTVESVESHGINFEYFVGNNSRIGFYAGNWLDVFGVDFSFTPLYHTMRMVENFQNGFWIDLTFFNIRLYINPLFNDYLFSPDELGEDICYFFNRWSYRYPDIECSYNYSIVNKILVFESWVGGEINTQFGNIITDSADFPTDITFSNNFHFAIDQELGLVLGFGQRGWVKGIINDEKVKVSMEFDFEFENYTMQDYQFGAFKDFTKNNLPLILSLSIGIPVIMSISIIIIFTIRKQRQ